MKIEVVRTIATFTTEQELEENADILEAKEWYEISKNCNELSVDFIRKFSEELRWDLISRKRGLSEEFIIEFEDKLRWSTISKTQKISIEFIERFEGKICFPFLTGNSNIALPKEFVTKHFEKFFFAEPDKNTPYYTSIFLRKYVFTLEEIEELVVRAPRSLECFLRYYKLPLAFLNKFVHLFNRTCWLMIEKHQQPGTDFMIKHDEERKKALKDTNHLLFEETDMEEIVIAEIPSVTTTSIAKINDLIPIDYQSSSEDK